MKGKKTIFAVLLSALILPLSAGVIISENGKTRAEIVTGKNPPASVRFAARELAEFLGRAGGCSIPIRESSSAPVRICLGVTPETRAAGIQPKKNDHIISVRKDGTIYLAGVDHPGTKDASIRNLFFNINDKGTLETVYTFLEKYVGVRWLEPGKAGEYVPVRNKLEIPFTEENLRPAFHERRCHYYRAVSYKNKIPDLSEFGTLEEGILWGMRLRYTSFRAPVFGCHSFAHLKIDRLLKKKPELFALQKDGSRSAKDLCWSNPETEELWFTLADAWFRGDATTAAAGWRVAWNPNNFFNRDEFMIDPHDYQVYFCCCERCRELRRPYGKNGQGELIWKVIFNVARRIEKKHLGKQITTLVYAPKRFLPSDRNIPRNLRVRVTVPWTAIIPDSPSGIKAQELIRQWGEAQPGKLYLWMYLRADFAASLPGIPEVAVHNMQKLFQVFQPYTQGIFFEHIEPTHTIRNIDQYVLAHLLWNPNLKLDDFLRDYCTLYFGKAGPDMLTFYRRLEDNWYRIAALRTDDGKLDAAEHSNLLRHIYDEIYNYRELTALEKLLSDAAAKVPKNSVEARRIDRYRRNVVQLAESNFSVFSSDKEHRFAPEQLLVCRTVGNRPTEKDWESAVWQNLHTNDKTARPDPNSRFKVLGTDRTFFVRAEYDEPDQSETVVSCERKKGDLRDIWRGNNAELFFSGRDGKILHLVVNDRGSYAVYDDATRTFKQDVPGITVRTTQTDRGWTFEAEIGNEVTGFAPNSNADRFNITRCRVLQGKKPQYYTWSKEAIGRWSLPDCFTRIQRVVVIKMKAGISGAARPAGTEPADMMISAQETGKSRIWRKWVQPGSRITAVMDRTVGHLAPGSRLLDYTRESLSGKEKTASWRYMIPVPEHGTRLRISVWVKAETTNPNAAAFLSVNWNNADKSWLKKHPELMGSAILPLSTAKWQRMQMEIIVPDLPDIAWMSVSIGGRNIRPGKLWIDDFQIEKIR